RAVDVRAAHVRARARRGGQRRRGVHARLLPPRPGSLSRGHGHEAVARHPEKPEAAPAAPALSRGAHQALLRAGFRADRRPLRPPQGLLRLDSRIGEVYLEAAEIAARVGALGAEIARDYRDREPLLVGSLKACIPLIVDLSRSIPIHHALDFVELSGYGSAAMGGHNRIRFIKDLDMEIAGRDVLIVDEVVDTGLTLNYLCRALSPRNPESLAAGALFCRPSPRLVDDLPIRYVGFTVPDEFFARYGFD